jgi:hypothetical protein
MRTVHETEALRPSDPVPKSMQPHHIKSGTRLKLVIKQQQAAENGNKTSDGGVSSAVDHLTDLSNNLGFTPAELAMNPQDLWRLLRRQLHWDLEESESIQRELEVAEATLQKEWAEKEILFDRVMKSENDWHKRREEVLATVPTAEELKAQALAQVESTISLGRQTQNGDAAMELGQIDAAAVLASLAQG